MSTSKLAEIVKLRVATVSLHTHSQLPTHSRILPTVHEIKKLPSTDTDTCTEAGKIDNTHGC